MKTHAAAESCRGWMLVCFANLGNFIAGPAGSGGNFLRDFGGGGVSQWFNTNTNIFNIQITMKKMNSSLLLAVGALGVVALATKLTASDSALPSCCMGGPATPMAADTSTNATPDLLKTCPVSGDKLGEMGKPFTFTYKDQEVKLCCKGCKKDFDKDPEKYIKLIRAADKK